MNHGSFQRLLPVSCFTLNDETTKKKKKNCPQYYGNETEKKNI